MDIIYIRIEINKTEKKNNNRKEDGPSQKEEKEDTHVHTHRVLRETMVNLQMWYNLKYKRMLWITLFQLI